MKSYKVLMPTGFMCDGKPATAWAGAVVQVDDDSAAELVAAKKLEPLDAPASRKAKAEPEAQA